MLFDAVFHADSEYVICFAFTGIIVIKIVKYKLIFHLFAYYYHQMEKSSIFSRIKQNLKKLNMYFCSSRADDSNEI